jgi:hypothetical protein
MGGKGSRDLEGYELSSGYYLEERIYLKFNGP